MPEREESQDSWHFQNSGFSRNITLHLLWSVHAARSTLVRQEGVRASSTMAGCAPDLEDGQKVLAKRS